MNCNYWKRICLVNIYENDKIYKTKNCEKSLLSIFKNVIQFHFNRQNFKLQPFVMSFNF